MKIVSLLFVLVTGHLVLIRDCLTPGCELPSVLQGSWAMTRFGLTNLGFNATHVTQFPVDKKTCPLCYTTYDFYCYSKTGTQFVLKSVKYAPLAGSSYKIMMYMCWDLKVVDWSTVVVHELTSLGAFGANRIKHTDKGEPPPESCNLITSNSDHGLLLKLDYLDIYNKTCPADILGKYVDSKSSCTLQIDVCTNTAIALSNITDDCSVKPLFTDESSVKCLHGEVQDGTTYLTVYHKDNSSDHTTEPFTCLAIRKSGDVVLMSQNPLFCLSDQTADSKTTDGKLTFIFSPTVLCPTTTPPPTTPPTIPPTTGLGPGAIAGIVFAILLLVALIVIILLSWCLLRKRREKKLEQEEQNVLDRKPVRGKSVHVKELAHHGRDYLLQMADFWESKGILPPRPHQTLPGAMPPKRPKSSNMNT